MVSQQTSILQKKKKEKFALNNDLKHGWIRDISFSMLQNFGKIKCELSWHQEDRIRCTKKR